MDVQRGPDLGRDMRSTGGVFGFFPRQLGGIMINTKMNEARDYPPSFEIQRNAEFRNIQGLRRRSRNVTFDAQTNRASTLCNLSVRRCEEADPTQ